LANYDGDWTFHVYDIDGNHGTIVDNLTVAPLPVADSTRFSPADGAILADTTPTFTWDAVTGTHSDRVKRYRVRIHTDDGNFDTVWRGYVGTETTYTLPPGVLEPNTSYRYRIDAYDARSNFDNDNVSQAPANGEDFLRFTTGSESAHPYIDMDSTGVHTWSGSDYGTTLNFWVRVFDPQGVPENIESVKAILPGGEEVFLRYEYSTDDTSGYYTVSTFAPLISDTYTLRVVDRDGNDYEVTEELDSDAIGFPDESSFTPTRSSLLGTTAVTFDWADVTGAAFYRVEIYDENFERIHRLATTESQYSLPEGYLKEGTYYSYRITTRREFFDENVDNGSASPWFRDNRFNFITTATTGSALPTINTDNWGAVLWQYPRPDDPSTSGYWMTFYIEVNDGDGLPHCIQRVEVTAPTGTTFPGEPTSRVLSYDGGNGYWYMETISDPTEMPEGTYTFTVTDANGNQATTTDVFTRNTLPLPTNLTPLPDADVYSPTPTISWNPVAGAAVYLLEIYDEAGRRIHRPYLTATSYTVPEGTLEENKTYSYRVRAHRNDPNTMDTDNLSSSIWFRGLRPHFAIRPFVDTDSDGIADEIEIASGCLLPNDADSDDDGIIDGLEDTNLNGSFDAGETDPCDDDTDGDGVQDGTEIGLTQEDVGSDTNTGIFIPDLDPSTTTDPLSADTDGDGKTDGEEDTNFNGRVDAGETDPNPKVKSLPHIPLLLLGD
jgi:hypothetical protein